MRGWRRAVGRFISSLYRTAKKVNPSPRGFRILMYHAVGSPVSGDTIGLYSIAPDRFKQHMREVSGCVDGGVVPLTGIRDRGIAVTFDDGFRDNLVVAAPILVHHGIPFTVFVTPGHVQSGNPEYLTMAGLRELGMVPGVSIGAHGNTHCRLTECDSRRLACELVDSRKWLEDALGRPVMTMAYPHGAVDRRVRDAAAAAGYELAVSSRFCANQPGDDVLWLGRTEIWAQDDLRTLRAKLSGDWDWLKCRR